MRKSQLLLAILVLLAIGLTACGRNNNNENQEPTNISQEGAPPGTAGTVVEMPPTEYLTIAVHMSQEGRFRAAAVSLQEAMALQGRDIEVIFNTFMDYERETIEDLLLSQFAAGLGPDIFQRDFSILLAPFVQEGFIQDLYPLLDRSPTSNRSDFFMNVLEGFEDNGRLYMLQTDFSMDFIGINANVPQAFINRFSALDRARPSDIFELYQDLITAHPEFAEMDMIVGLTQSQAIAPEFTNAVSVSNGDMGFTGFATHLDRIRDGFYDADRFGMWTPWNALPEEMDEIAEYYVFFRVAGIHTNKEVLFDYDSPWFVEYVPFVDESGRIVDRTFANVASVAISATANDPDLAWAFVEHLISTEAQGFRAGSNIPIRREYFDDAIRIGLQNSITQRPNRPFMFDMFTAMDNAVMRLERYVEMEFTSVPANYMWSSALIIPAIMPFFDGEISSDEAVSLLYESFTNWMSEERVIEPYVPTIVEPLPDLPARVLTVHGSDIYTAVIEQAAAAMNASWRLRDEPYIFQIIIDEYSQMDWDNMDVRADRLRVELMAGGGPDIFFVSPFHTIFDYASAGFLANLYTLMDNSPSDSRNNYLPELLRAFEIGGRLYTLPLNANFIYTSIHRDMPPSILNRFLQKSTISVIEMMDMYLELIQNYPDQFGHMLPGLEGRVGTPYSFMIANIDEFVNFNNRTANFNSTGFISLLELTRTLNDIVIESGNWGLGHGWVFGPLQSAQFLHDRSDFMFNTTDFRLNPISLFFEMYEEEVYLNPIPITNSMGELLLEPGNMWGEIALTTAGNTELAWEFMQYILEALVEPVGRARINPGWGNPADWLETVSTPVHHPHTMHFVRNIVEEFVTRPGFAGLFPTAAIPEERERQLNDLTERLSRYNNMPMATTRHHLPHEMLMFETIMEFFDDIITAQVAAQRIQNTVQLWLDEA